MQRVLDHLIAEAPEENEGAVDVQLQIRGGIHAGALRVFNPHQKGPEFDPGPGGQLYELTSLMQNKEGQPLMIKMFFRADAVDCVMQNCVTETPVIATHKSGLIIPGAH